jgi:hypothetical protein
MLDEEHFLGAGREAGDRLCQFVIEDGRVAAVLIWCAAAWHIKDRDTIIGWDPVTRSRRLKLVAQLRRFLVPEQSRRPNLASQCLGRGLRELPAQWQAEHGYRPLLAESFSDPESHHGTVYKATNWTCEGDTKVPEYSHPGPSRLASGAQCLFFWHFPGVSPANRDEQLRGDSPFPVGEVLLLGSSKRECPYFEGINLKRKMELAKVAKTLAA